MKKGTLSHEATLNLICALVVFTEALLISWALMYLAEYFGWHLVRELGGGTASAFWSVKDTIA